jgi:nicotinic acid mononucleotide adenylyltransferase
MVTVLPFADVPDPSGATVYLLDHEPFPISSTSIRDRQHRGLPIRELVPHEVNSYIEKYGLYRRAREVSDDHGGR